MKLIQRVQDILLKPQPTWPVIEQEATDVASFYKQYLVILAAIPAVATFIGFSLVGVGGFGMSFRLPIGAGLTQMVVSYVLGLVTVFVLALIVDALAPSFGGTKNQVNALKVVGYSMTASFVGGIFHLIPSLSVLGLLAAIYGIYLLYLGLPVLMKCPPDKAAGYTAVAVVCYIVLSIVIGAVVAFSVGRGGMMGGWASGARHDSDVVISTPKGEVKIDTAKMDELAKKMEEAGKRIEDASKSGDSAAVGSALGDMMKAMAGGEPIPAQDLKAALPEAAAGLKRDRFEAESTQFGSSARASYAADDKQLDLSVTDVGGTAGLAALGWAAAITLDRETDGKVEKVYKQGARTVREEYQKDGSAGEYALILSNGLVVEAKGRNVGQGALKSTVEGLDLARLESLKRATKS